MFRNRVRPPLPPVPPLDEATAERLLGRAEIEDLPDAYRPLGELLAAASGPATPEELEGSAAAAAAFLTAHHAANGKRRRVRSVGASVLTALAVAASTGTAVAATLGALPEPVQQVAHEALGVVGINVPGITGRPDRAPQGTAPTSTTTGAGATTAVVPGVGPESAQDTGTGTATDPTTNTSAATDTSAPPSTDPNSGTAKPDAPPVEQKKADQPLPVNNGTGSPSPVPDNTDTSQDPSSLAGLSNGSPIVPIGSATNAS